MNQIETDWWTLGVSLMEIVGMGIIKIYSMHLMHLWTFQRMNLKIILDPLRGRPWLVMETSELLNASQIMPIGGAYTITKPA